MNNAHYRVLCNAWEKWVKNKGNTVLLSNNSTRKTIKSVLGTREESEVAQQQVGNQQGNNDNGGDSAGARSVVQYESYWDDHPRFGGSPWCARGATQVRQVTEVSKEEKESHDSESSSSEDESSVENEDSNPLNMELAVAADAPATGKGRKRKATPLVVATGPVSQSMMNSRKKSAQK
jgi:hypothetical protein